MRAARLVNGLITAAIVSVAATPCWPATSAATHGPPTAPPLAWVAAGSVREHGCSDHAGLRAPLRHDRALDQAAERWAGGSRLQTAIEASGYRQQQSAALHVHGDAQALRGALVQDLCAALTDRHFRDLGSAAHGDDTWIVLAAPFTPPSGPPAAVAAAVLAQVNAARAVARRCGTRRFPAAPPLRLNALLARAAAAHARDMLEHDYFSHTGSDGSTPGQRILAAGYHYQLAGENIAFGPQDTTQAVQGWLESPGHCANIMDPGFRDTGVAYISNTRGAPRIYWVQDFGAPPAPTAR